MKRRSRNTIAQIDRMLMHMWDHFRVEVTHMFVNPRALKRIWEKEKRRKMTQVEFLRICRYRRPKPSCRRKVRERIRLIGRFQPLGEF